MDGGTKDFGATTVLLEFLRKISLGHNLDIEAGFNGQVIATISKSGFSPALREKTIEPWKTRSSRGLPLRRYYAKLDLWCSAP